VVAYSPVSTTGKPKIEIARLLGISRQTLNDILDERRPVTLAMALRLGKLGGNGPSCGSTFNSASTCVSGARTRERPRGYPNVATSLGIISYWIVAAEPPAKSFGNPLHGTISR
jgi:hypothetical protein